MDIVHSGDSNRILLSPKREHPMIIRMLMGINLLLLFSSCLFIFLLKKEGGKGMDIIHPGDFNRILLGPKGGHFMVNRMLTGVNLLLLSSPSCFVFLLKKKGGQGMDILHPVSSNRILLGPKHGHSMVNGILLRVNLLLLSSSSYLFFIFKKEEGKGRGIVHIGDSYTSLLGPKR